MSEQSIREKIEKEIMKTVEGKVSALQTQMDLLQSERRKVATLKSDLENKSNKVQEERQAFVDWKDNELAEFES